MLILQLDRTLPLANNTEIQWLDVSNGPQPNGSDCFSTIFNYSLPVSFANAISLCNESAFFVITRTGH